MSGILGIIGLKGLVGIEMHSNLISKANKPSRSDIFQLLSLLLMNLSVNQSITSIEFALYVNK